MALLPSGFAIPQTPYLVAILGLGVLAVVALWTVRPTVNQAAVVAFGPWMVTGGAMYALFQAEVLPPIIAPMFGSPAVYVTTFAIAGLVWALGARYDFMAPVLVASTGVATMIGAIGAAIAFALTWGTLAPLWPAVAVLGSVVGTAGLWMGARWQSIRVADTGYAGLLVVFGHVLDGLSTAIGDDVLGFGEQTPLSRVLLDVGGALPPAAVFGSGWLFVLVKVALALVVVRLLADLVRKNPTQGYVVLGGIAAVGLGPGAHNVVLFVMTAA